MRRYEISEPQWTRIAPLLPHRTHHGQAGHPFNDLRPIVNGILWILHTGAPWRDLPERYGPPGRRSSGASTGGGRTALGAVSSPRCWTNWTTKGRSITTSGVSMAPSSGPARRRRGRKKTRAAPSNWAGQRRRKCKSRLTMRWDVPGAGLARRSIWSVTATVSSSQSISPPDKRMRAKCSSPRWPVGCFSAAAAKVDGHDESQPTRGTAIRDPAVVSAAADRSRHSHASQPATEQALQQGHLSAATHRRAGRGLVQRVSCPGHSLRETRSQLCCLMAGGHHGQGPPSAIPKHSVVDTRTSLAVYV